LLTVTRAGQQFLLCAAIKTELEETQNRPHLAEPAWQQGWPLNPEHQSYGAGAAKLACVDIATTLKQESATTTSFTGFPYPEASTEAYSLLHPATVWQW
jgi:hypothetical protein